MAKKDRTTDSAAPSTVPNRDLMQRMSFLYQASVHLRAHAGAAQSASAADEMTRLSRKHVRTVKAISNGSVVKLDPSVKRVLCKACDTVLVPGSTATVRVKTSGPHGKTISYTCVSCHTRREIPASPTPSKTGNEAGGKSKARPPPFFARVDAGHVRVRGTERICDE